MTLTTRHAIKKRKNDPADAKQQIADIQVHLLTCRYWILKEWECANMSSPFWRLYHNSCAGAAISFKEKWIDIEPSKMYLIPPHTPFSTSLKRQLVDIDHENIQGRRIEASDHLDRIKSDGFVDHLFVHFNLGMVCDMVEPQIMAIDCEERHFEHLKFIKSQIVTNHDVVPQTTSLTINILIMEMLMQISPEQWHKHIVDRRVADAVRYLREYELVKITNEELADRANMATNAFARLFKENTGMTIQQYLMKMRIEKACLLMHHSPLSIDDIAMRCGFFDRHHFSKAFKQSQNVSPAFYMKRLTMSS